MKMSKRKLLSIITVAALSFAFAAVLAGCGGGSASSSAAASSGSAAASSAAASTAAASSAAASSAAASKASGPELRFVTGGEAGTYYAFGSVIAQHATNNAGVAVTAASSGGSQANIQELEDGTAELGFCQTDVMAYAYNGTNLFENAVDCFSVLGSLYQEQVQIVTCDENIKTVADLKGKKVSIGAAGSGVFFNAIDILGAYGLTEDDISPTYQNFGDSANDLKDGKIDAAFIVAGAPTTAIEDLSASKKAYLVSLDDEHVAKLLDSSPYYSEATIAAGTYGMKEDVKTVGVEAVILVNDSVSEDAVQALCADIFDNAEKLVDNHAKYKEVSIEKGASVTSVPYHPGAAKYFSEKGIEVPTK